MKYFELYKDICKLYKIPIFALIGTIILLEHKAIAYTFYALACYEIIDCCIRFYFSNRKEKKEYVSYEIVKIEKLIELNKQEATKSKIKIKGAK